MKRISQESIENIRSDGNVFNINVDEKTSGTKSHLPGSTQESKYSQPKQVRDILIFAITTCKQFVAVQMDYLIQSCVLLTQQHDIRSRNLKRRQH